MNRWLILCVLFVAASAFGQTTSCPNSGYCATVAWSAASSGVAPTGYKVYRTTTNNGCVNVTAITCGLVASVGSSVRSYLDIGIVSNTVYYWVITATNGSGESLPTPQIYAATGAFFVAGGTSPPTNLRAIVQ